MNPFCADEMGLRQAIIAQPDDDTLRLVYADWLESHSEVDHAAFIRLQIEMEWNHKYGGGFFIETDQYRDMRKQEGILLARADQWLAWPTGSFLVPITILDTNTVLCMDGAYFYMERGMVGTLLCSWHELGEYGLSLIETEPVHTVRFTKVPDEVDVLDALPSFPHRFIKYVLPDGRTIFSSRLNAEFF